ncbi:MAG: menaquinone reductase multiheme cytochrome c subunit QrcA [Thermodesulfobacteriota bacterium]|nr:menaquinone reductase multiheme cytochrome c subunit QrcA [Thermodesulfobacteriota bacterium]
MSEFDDKSKDASVNGDGAGAKTGNGGVVVFLSFLVGLIAALIIGWVVFPAALYSEKEQPVQFSHDLHVNGEYMECSSCHYFRADGTFAGVPKLYDCTGCHEYAIGNTEAELNFVDNYVVEGKEVPWLIYSKQPDCVFFSHAAHVKEAGMDCVSCHGHIGTSTSLKTYQENRITGYSRDIWGKDITGIFKKQPWDSMKMDDCARCHERETGSKGACFQCHK